MSKLLHIETSTKVCSVAISENGTLIDLLEEQSEKYIHAERLTLFIKEICERNSWKLQQLDAVVVASGPGSYTGLRIGVSTAKGLCYALDIPLISINSIESIAQLMHKKYPDQNICAMIDAKRMEVFSTIYNAQFEIIKPLSADVLEKETYREHLPFVVSGDAAAKTRKIWKGRNLLIDSSIVSSAAGQVELAYQKYLQKEGEDIAYFVPQYLKDFKVTPSKKKSF